MVVVGRAEGAPWVEDDRVAERVEVARAAERLVAADVEVEG